MWYNSYWGYEHNYKFPNTVVSIRDGGLVRWSAATCLPTGNALHGSNLDYSDPRIYKLVVLDPFAPKARPTCQVLCAHH